METEEDAKLILQKLLAYFCERSPDQFYAEYRNLFVDENM